MTRRTMKRRRRTKKNIVKNKIRTVCKQWDGKGYIGTVIPKLSFYRT